MRSTCFRRPAGGIALVALIALVAPSHEATAHNFCASTAQELRDALAQVSDGGPYVDEPSIIAIGPGVYATGGTPFRSEALTSTAKLDIIGSWGVGCSSRPPGPPTTVLDAGGVGGVLVIKRPHAFVYLRRMVLRNGNADVGAGLQMNYGTTPTAMVALYQMDIRNNHASGNGGGLYISASAPPNFGAIGIASSLIADNSSGGDGGGAYLEIAGGYRSSLSSLTIASNTAAGTAGGIAATGAASTYEMISTIAWGNTPASVRFDLPSTIAWSNIELIAPGAALEIDEVTGFDPMFVDPAAGNYYFGNVPGLARSGAPHLYVPADLDDHAFPPNQGRYRADMGAYMDTRFVHGFEVDEVPWSAATRE